MANFLTFEENKVLINDKIFPANGINLQLNANTVPVKDIYGNILYYSPTGPIQGTVGISFFLTGQLPDYFKLENQNESPIKLAFNTILIPDCYLTNLSFSVSPFEPIPVKADLVFYHGIKALNTDPVIVNAFATNIFPRGIANSNQSFTSGLNILNGTASYILTDNRSSWSENPTDLVVTDFNYQFSVERVPILRVGDTFPTRVAMKEGNAEFTITTNNIDGYLDIHGNTAEFSAVLRDSTNLSIYDTVELTGIIVDQSYEIGEDNYGLSKIKMTQALNRKRSIVTIPVETDNPNIINPPTNNIANPPNTPNTNTIKKEVDEESPRIVIPDIGGNFVPPPEELPDSNIYFALYFAMSIYGSDSPPIIYEKLTISPIIKAFIVNNLQLYFEIVTYPEFTNTLIKTTNDSYNKDNVLGCIFKVNQNFITYFASSDFYNNNVDNIAFQFTFDSASNQPVKIINYKYDDLNSWVNNGIVPFAGDGSKQKPYKLKLPEFIYFGPA